VRRAVLDPNVLISGLLSPGGATGGILIHLRSGAFELIVSPALIAELREVLLRERFRKYVTVDEVERFVAIVAREGTSYGDPPPIGPDVGVDPDDEYLIRLARAANADALVSGDPHLTRLRSRIPVQTPREFLESLEP
jgi:putative PIN family toxin of toxin-antitoxin system